MYSCKRLDMSFFLKNLSKLNPITILKEHQALKKQVLGLRASKDFEALVHSKFWIQKNKEKFSTAYSCLPHMSDFHDPKVIDWCRQFKEVVGPNRKLWEWCFISEALKSRGLLTNGKKGLGFAVGQEPLTSAFASMGCEILATDGSFENAEKQGWTKFGEHSGSLDDLNLKGICNSEVFKQKVKFQFTDMNHIPNSFKNFDFLWSACAIEHLGSIEKGLSFVINSLQCLNPGGVAVHTLELNMSSREETVDHNNFTVIFRTQDLIKLSEGLKREGYEVATLDFTVGSHPLDTYVDLTPFAFRRLADSNLPHLKIFLEGYISSSYGLVIKKNS